MVEGDAALANGIAFFDCFGDISLCQGRGFEERPSGGELRSERGRKGTAGAVRVFYLYLVGGQMSHFSAFKQDVYGALQVTALDDDGVRTHLDEFAGGGFHVRRLFDGQPRQDFGLGDIRSNHADTLEKFRRYEFDSTSVEKLRPAGRLDHRVKHDVRELVCVEEFGGSGGVSAIAEHPDLYGGDVAILSERFELRTQLRARNIVNGFHSLGVLDRNRGNGGDAIASVRGERL